MFFLHNELELINHGTLNRYTLQVQTFSTPVLSFVSMKMEILPVSDKLVALYHLQRQFESLVTELN